MRPRPLVHIVRIHNDILYEFSIFRPTHPEQTYAYLFRFVQYADVQGLWPGQGLYRDCDYTLINLLVTTFHTVADYAPSLQAYGLLLDILEANKDHAYSCVRKGCENREVLQWYDEHIEFVLGRMDQV